METRLQPEQNLTEVMQSPVWQQNAGVMKSSCLFITDMITRHVIKALFYQTFLIKM